VDCDDVAFLLAAGEARTLTSAEEAHLHDHLGQCRTCNQLTAEAAGEKFRWVVRIPDDALDDRDLLVLPTVDPIVFEGGPELAHGGMGRILRARDRRLGREVAIKEVLSPKMRARFEREVAITARLQHPAIVPVYEAGTWPNGTTFYAMRLVSGGTLDEAIHNAKTLEERLALLPKIIAVTDALAYAHEHRIIHRDLKPGNVLVGEHGETVVIDWGLAKQLGEPDAIADGDAPRTSDLTIAGSVMGTPCYASPEQAEGKPVDERSDVFALGAILYTLLAGQPPYFDSRVGLTPSQLLALAIDQPPKPIGELAPRAPLDLRVVVERAMAHDPAERYANAKEMADELRRFEAGQLLRSREYPMRELIARWVRRHRAAVTVATIAFLIVAGVGISAIVGIARSRADEQAAREAAETAARVAEDNVTALVEEQGRNQLVAGEDERAFAYLADAFHRGRDTPALREMLASASRNLDLLEATATTGGKSILHIAFTPDGKLVTIDPDELVVWNGAAPAVRYPVDAGGEVARIDSTGRRAVVLGKGGRIAAYDVASGAQLWTATEPDLEDGEIDLDPHGERVVVTANAGKTIEAQLRDAGTGALIAKLKPWVSYTFTRDGGRVAACANFTCMVWDARTGRMIRFHDVLGHPLLTPEFIDDDRLVVGSVDRSAWILRAGQPEIQLGGHYGEVLVVAVQGDLIATADASGAIRLWNAAGGAVGELRDTRSNVMALAFSPDGTRLLAAGEEARAYVWDTSTLERIAAVDAFHGALAGATFGPAHRVAPRGAIWAPDGRHFATLGFYQNVARLWRAPAEHRIARFVSTASATTDTHLIATRIREIARYRFDDGELVSRFDPHVAVSRVIASRDGTRALAFPGDEPRAVICDLVAGRAIGELALDAEPSLPLHVIKLSDDGRRAVALPKYEKNGGPVRVFDTSTGRVMREFPAEYVADVSFSPDGDRVAVAFAGVRPPALWKISTGETLPMPALPAYPMATVFDRSGRRLIVYGGPSVFVIDVATAKIATTLDASAPGALVNDVRIDDAGNRVATFSDDRVVRVWNADTGALLMTVEGVPEHSFAIAGNGARVATASFDGKVRVWDVASGRVVEVFRADAGGGLVWSSDGTRLVARSGDDTTASLLDVHPDRRSPAEIDALAARVTRWRVVDGLLVDR
jgi:eukaryotic-like serine/threonine-protein kinase